MKHLSLLLLTCILISTQLFAQTYPPSSVITAPHSNAYFKENTDVVIRVYATDIGKSQNNGTVEKVEFYNGTVKLGESTSHTNNTFSFTWGCVQQGTYTVTAIATNSSNVSFTSAGVTIHIGSEDVATPGLSSCKGKYLANIIGYNTPNSDYLELWNGVTAENGSKWGSIEATRDNMDFSNSDMTYQYAEDNNLMYRYHAIAWGSQYPTWLEALSTDVPAFRAEIEEYMSAVADRYDYLDQIDVLNENLYLNTWNGEEHQVGTPYFRTGLGGTGTTGYDWLIWLFTKAREYFPNSKLIMNDFELVNNTAGINEMLDAVKVLRDRGLIDGFGTQSHCFNVDAVQSTPNTLKGNLDLMASSGLPVYVTELDLNGGNTPSEQGQLTSYTNLFPVYWEHTAVAGISLWGYVEDDTWKEGTGILNSDRSERSAMTWLKNYMADLDDVGYPYCQTSGCTNPATTPKVSITSPASTDELTAITDITITAEASDPDGTVSSVEIYLDNNKAATLTSEPYTYIAKDLDVGTYSIYALVTDNDGNQAMSGSVQVEVGGVTVMGDITVSAYGAVGDETVELIVDGAVVKEWTLSTTNTEYTAQANLNGEIIINYTNDDGADRDAFIDYILVGDTKYEAEDQVINTGYYANGSCGGGSHSETMHCSGYILFETEPISEELSNGISLQAGWNLIGCPLAGETDIETALSSIWEHVIQVKNTDEFYESSYPSNLNVLKTLQWARGYWIKVDTSCTLTWD